MAFRIGTGIVAAFVAAGSSLFLGCGGRATGCGPGDCPEPLDVPSSPDEPIAELPVERSCGSPDGVISAELQSDLEALRGCTSLLGSLAVGPDADLDLEPLSALRHVQGYLVIGGPTDTDFTGPDNRYPPTTARARGLADLSGLSNLQSVEALFLRGLAVETLEPLGQLQSLESLGISECHELRNLAGLENVRELERVTIERNAALRSLQGFPALDTLYGLNVAYNPGLRDITALASLRRVYTMKLAGRRISDLAPLAELESLQVLALEDVGVVDLSPLDEVQGLTEASLRGLPDLERLEGLGAGALERLMVFGTGITRADALANHPALDNLLLENNDRLTDLDGIAPLERLSSLTVRGNDSITTFLSLASGPVIHYLEVSNNLRLEHAPSSLAGFVGGRRVRIDVHGNPALQSFLGLSNLQTVEELSVFDNPQLERFEVPRLEKVLILDMRCNPSLPQQVPQALIEALDPPLALGPAPDDRAGCGPL